MGKHYIFFLFFAFFMLDVAGQNVQDSIYKKHDEAPIKKWEKFSVNGEIQSDFLFSVKDAISDSTIEKEQLFNNSYLQLAVKNNYLESGIRYEYLKYPLPGFEEKFSGAGITHFFIRGRYKQFDLTIGDFYDQFGSGFIFKTFEERGLGIDNALRGGRLIFVPLKGTTIKILGGKQRFYFEKRVGRIFGSDLEMRLSEWFPLLHDKKWNVTLGSSFVSKKEPDEIVMVDAQHRLHLPENVFAYDVRTQIQRKSFSLLLEYAHKKNDPSFDNNYTYSDGSVVFLSTAYLKKGTSVLFQAKRSENMSFRSIRSNAGLGARINFLSPFAVPHSYRLTAYYPYATNWLGEWALQGEFRQHFKRKTWLGGKYGTFLNARFAHIRSLQTNDAIPAKKGEDGIKTAFFSVGNQLFYQDLNIELSKKLSRKLSLSLIYLNQQYNQKAIEGHGHNGDMVHTNVFVADMKYVVNRNFILRSDFEYLHTHQDLGSWGYANISASLFSRYQLSVTDMYNYGETDTHYPLVGFGFTQKGHRFQVSYGRIKGGINCAGGICRVVPSTNGLNVSYNYLF